MSQTTTLCPDCGNYFHSIGAVDTVEAYAQDVTEYDWDGYPITVNKDVSVPVRYFVLRCKEGHTILVDSYGFWVDANYQLTSFKRLAPDPTA